MLLSHFKIQGMFAMKVCSELKDFFVDDSAVAAVEYTLMVSLVAITIVASLNELGNQMNITFSKVASIIASANEEGQ